MERDFVGYADTPPIVPWPDGARLAVQVSVSYEELVDNYYIVAGTPDEVADRFARVRRELGIGHLLLEAQESRMDHATTMRSIELMGKSVIPAMARI